LENEKFPKPTKVKVKANKQKLKVNATSQRNPKRYF